MNLRKAFVSTAAILMAGLLPFSAFQNTLLADSDINDKSDKENITDKELK